ncbi:MAG: rhomboid family intramembrane serine protease [Bacillota bacterium]
MSWLDKLERRFGRLAIPGLMYYIILLNAAVYFLLLFDRTGTILDALTLQPGLVMQGEVWRLLTFIFIPPSTSPLFILFILYFYYLVGTALEQEWGSFKFNLYYLVGMIATAAGAFLTGGGATGVYLNLSLFLAFAYIYPDYEILIFFILPLKIKYLAWLDWAFIAYTALVYPVPDKVVAVVSVANYLLFFGKELLQRTNRRREVYYNRKRFRDNQDYTEPAHVCEFCGMTERTDPQMEFRHCPECDPRYEYCAKHLNAHRHQKKD